MKYKICPYCNGNLPPWEKCDCLREKERERQEMNKVLAVGYGNQITFNFEERKSKEV